MKRILAYFGLCRKKSFVERVIERHKANKPVSAFARSLVESETAETINARFAKAMQKAKERP